MAIFKKKPIHANGDDYSKDADQTRFLRMAFTLALVTIVGLFALEISHHIKPGTSMLFTPEIVHILVNGLAIGFIGLGAYIYGKNAGTNEALARMAGGGMNGKEQPKQNQTNNKEMNS